MSFQCEPGLGASVMYDLLYNKPQKLMLLAGCSTVCTTVAEAAKMWNLVVVSTEKRIHNFYDREENYQKLENLLNTVSDGRLILSF